MHRLASFRDLHQHDHTLGLYCMACERWSTANLEALIQAGDGERSVVGARFRCKDCGAFAEKQVRPPVPQFGGAVLYPAF